MNLYFLFIIGLILIGAKFFIKDFNKEYLSKENTSSIKGIFILIVFFSHIMSYIKVSKTHSFLMLGVRNFLGQLMVTLFLFYSGYGIYESIKKKKEKYINTIPKNRCLKTFFHYAIAITGYLILRYYLGQTYPIKTIILAYLAWDAIGASNWYIFAIILLYFITFLSFKVFDNNDKYAIRLTWILTIIATFGLSLYRPAYCYNTILCYTFGLSYSYYKEDIEKFFFKNNSKYLICMFLSLISMLILKKYATHGYMYYELLSIVFVIFMIGITMKVNLKSKVLKWLGDNLFWVYIWQRLPMIYLNSIGYNVHPYRHFLISFGVTILLTIASRYLVPKIDKLIFREKKKV